MKDLMPILTIVLSLAGSANFAMAQSYMAQSYSDMGVSTGSEAKRQARLTLRRQDETLANRYLAQYCAPHEDDGSPADRIFC